MDSCCRVCSRSDEFRRFPVFAMADLSQEVIATMITSCSDTQVSSEDGLPQHICPDCLITLSLAYSFRKLCRRTDAKFRDSYESRRPSQSVEQPPRRSQSQAHDNTYETIPVIKEEVEFFDYECDVPPSEDQWVIQNPRTIREGAMAVVHSAQYYDEADDNAERAASALLPMGSLDDSHDPSEMGEGSGSARKHKKKAPIPEPERFSKRIRRQSEEFGEGEIAADESKELEVLKTSRGKDLLAMEGYVFYKNSQRGSRCYWECKGRSRKPDPEGQQPAAKCPARVTTDFFDNRHELLSYKGVHTHAPDVTQIQEIKQRNMLKDIAASDTRNPAEIIRQVHDATALPTENLRLSKTAQRKIIKRARMEEHHSEPVSLETVEVPFDFLQTMDGSQFFQGNVKVDHQTAFIFATQTDLKNLSTSSFWLAASTFSTKTGLQRQLLTIHSSVSPYNQHLCPAVYILMASSSEPLYRQVLTKIKQLAEGLEVKLNPQLVLTDFEKPLVSALEAEFPHARLSVCFFHFSHHLFRAVESHGLSMSFEKNYWLLQNYKRVKALAFLPAEHIPDAFYVLKSNAPLELHRFLDDFAENYIFGKVMLVGVDGTSVRGRPQFGPAFWSLHASIMLGIPNTYQQTKEWHYRMARLLTAHHAEPDLIFRAFQREQQEAQLRMVAFMTGMGPSRKTEEEQRSESIRHIAANFTSYSTLQFLDAIADGFGTDAR